MGKIFDEVAEEGRVEARKEWLRAVIKKVAKFNLGFKEAMDFLEISDEEQIELMKMID